MAFWDALGRSLSRYLGGAVLSLAIQSLRGNVLTPRIQAQTIRVPSVLIFMGVLAEGALPGIWGCFSRSRLSRRFAGFSISSASGCGQNRLEADPTALAASAGGVRHGAPRRVQGGP